MRNLPFAIVPLLLAGAALPAATVPVLTVRGPAIVTAQDGAPVRLRGFNTMWWAVPSDDDVAEMKRMGVNCIRHVFGYKPKGAYDRTQLTKLETDIRRLTAQGLWVVPVLHDCALNVEGGKQRHPWHDETVQREYLDLMEDVVRRLKDEPLVVAWEPINEPHNGTARQVADWYRTVVPRIRTIDALRPVVVAGTDYSWPKNLTDDLLVPGGNAIYAFHFYAPWEYTHAKDTPPKPYPGTWGRDWLAKQMEPAKAFADRHQVPVWCGEWGTFTRSPGHEAWLRDVATLLERNALHWTHWAWCAKGKDPGSDDSFDVNRQKTGILGIMREIFTQTKTTP